MSGVLAIAGVTAVLKDLLDSGMIDHKLTDAMGEGVMVTAVAPDAVPVGGAMAPRLNLFMHQATPNPGWRNVVQPSHGSDGGRLSNPPLALDLHYLVTAYAAADMQAEVLLGYAMLLLHETPVLARQDIRRALDPVQPIDGSILPSIYQALRLADLADQIEQIKITPTVMNMEDLSKLWSACQAHYRPSAAYLATVVLIEGVRPGRTPLPVLTRGLTVQPDTRPPSPEVNGLILPAKQVGALPGDVIMLEGRKLAGTGHKLILINPRFGFTYALPATTANDTVVGFTAPKGAAALPTAVYQASLELQQPGAKVPVTAAAPTIAFLPQLTATPASVGPDAAGDITVTVTCLPPVRPSQRVSLLLDAFEAFAQPFTANTANPVFIFNGLPPAIYRARLRVSGQDSPHVDRSTTPPVFLGPKIKVTA